MTDVIIGTILLLLIIWGAKRGFLQSLVGPLSFFISLGLAWIYFEQTKNMAMALLISIFGSILLNLIFRLLFKVAGTTSPSIISRLLGAIITPTWGLVFILPIIFVISILPEQLKATAALHQDVMKSYTYALSKPHLERLMTAFPSPVSAPSGNANAPASAESGVEDLMEDSRFQDIAQDPEIMKAAQDKNIAALMSNPKVMAIAQDPELVKKLLSVYAQMQKEGSTPQVDIPSGN